MPLKRKPLFHRPRQFAKSPKYTLRKNTSFTMVFSAMSSFSQTTQNQGTNRTAIDSLAYQPPMVSMQETFGHDLHPWQADIVATLF
jgi:hypothetical protein